MSKDSYDDYIHSVLGNGLQGLLRMLPRNEEFGEQLESHFSFLTSHDSMSAVLFPENCLKVQIREFPIFCLTHCLQNSSFITFV